MSKNNVVVAGVIGIMFLPLLLVFSYYMFVEYTSEHRKIVRNRNRDFLLAQLERRK